MDKHLLPSKLHIPCMQTGHIKRLDLLRKLDADHIKKLILVSAPAGFGKSTTIADWIRSTGQPSAWVSLEDSDNDPIRFLSYILAALQTVDPNLDDSALVFFQSPSGSALEAALTVLMSQLEEIKTDFLLVLDDYHLIREKSIHQILEFILVHQPLHMHIVLLTRADPPLALGKMRANKELSEIRSQDLKFSAKEAQEFFSIALQKEITGRDLQRLVERTEGWISGLQMAAISMQGKREVSEFVGSFSGSHRYILDYLMEEVLAGQSREMRQFLYRTSILDQFCAPLCSAVSGIPGAQEILLELENSNMFIFPLDDVRYWYRYHRLFADFLQARLHEKSPAQLRELHLAASRWYESSGLITQAVEHALSAPDYQRAAGLVQGAAESKLVRSEIATLLRWIESLPLETRQAFPRLAFYGLWAQMLVRYQFEAILLELGKLEGIQDIPPGWADTLRAFIEISLTNLEAAGIYAQQALDSLSREDVYFRAICLWCAGLSQAFNQNLEDSYRVLEELLEVSRSQNNIMFAVMTASHMARIRLHQGNLKASEKIYLQALEAAKDRRGNLLPIAGEIKMGLGDLYRELDELDKAAENIQQGIELSTQWRDAAAMEGYIYLGRVKEAQGELESAGDAFDKALQMARKYDAIDVDDRMVQMWQARFWISRGWLDKALAWAESLQAGVPQDLGAGPESNRLDTMLGMRESVVLARLFTANGDYERASQLIERLVPAFETLGNLDTVIELMLLKVKTLLGLGDEEQAEDVMKRTISIARDTGFKRIFLDAGQPVRDLLHKPGIQRLAPDYVGGLLPRSGQPQPREKLRSQALPEALSERELEVLRYLRTNLTTPEIADEMVIGVNTVRTHIKNIYSKLNVHKRFEAVERGKELKLI